MKFLKQFIIAALAASVLAAGTLGFEPQKNENKPPPPKERQQVPNPPKNPPPRSDSGSSRGRDGGDSRGSGDSKGSSKERGKP